MAPPPPEEGASSFVAEVRRAVDARLDALLAEAEREASEAGEEPRAIVDATAALVRRGGKRLRPALLAASFRACGGNGIPSAVVDAGAAWELLQAYFLIHDDWMDGDATRRGGPTAHVVLAQRHRGDAHLGAALAVLAGDYACALAHRVLAEIPAPIEAMALFSRVHQEVVLGQALDLTLVAHDGAAVERMHTLKTGSYTVRGPLAMGAMLAKASSEMRSALDRFAAPIGVAFQLRDDLLGVFGSEEETGKPVGSDLRAKKRTSLLAEALRRSSGTERARLEALDDVDWARGFLESSGARAAIEARVSSLLGEARRALDEAPLDPRGRELLAALAVRLAERKA
ncbi:MAG: polyprenyl synthetase family protein [Polyangiales bacterium]